MAQLQLVSLFHFANFRLQWADIVWKPFALWMSFEAFVLVSVTFLEIGVRYNVRQKPAVPAASYLARALFSSSLFSCLPWKPHFDSRALQPTAWACAVGVQTPELDYRHGRRKRLPTCHSRTSFLWASFSSSNCSVNPARSRSRKPSWEHSVSGIE